MKVYKYYTFFFLTVFINLFVFGQIPTPNNDPNWQLDSKSDEFNSTTFNTSKWTKLDLANGIGLNWGHQDYFRPSNVTISSSGYLNLEATEPNNWGDTHSGPYNGNDTNATNFCCFTGGVSSVNRFNYGYVEMSAIFPGVIDNEIGYSKKFWPAFWLIYGEPCGYSIPNKRIYDEIDIVDPGWSSTQEYYKDGKTIFGGFIDEKDDCMLFTENNSIYLYPSYTSSVFLCEPNTYHKYGMEWNSEKITIYFDSNPIYQISNDITNITHPMYLMMDIQIQDSDPSFDQQMTFPQNMKIDYLRYWTLKKNCQDAVTIDNNTDLINFSYSVKSSITFTSNSITIPTSGNGSNGVYRAVNGITINSDFTVPNGAECLFIATPCD